ncbi:30S ribosomal protein S20 [Buchnera aphidicola]|uniref:30S ribosomal protein S20 n=1 Tax=Buchnera aphidicola TaxID=9 RepID=UPI0031B6700A
MANIKSAKKRILISEKKRKINVSMRSKVKTFIKKVLISIKNNRMQEAQKNFKILQPILDRSVSKGVIHKNKSSRYKSNLISKIKKIKNI